MSASPRFSIAVAIIAAALSAPAGAQSCYAGPPVSIGSITVVARGLPASTRMPNSTVDALTVHCRDLPDIGVLLQVTPPPAGVSERGTVVLGSGALGTTFYSAETNGFPLALALHQLGFRVVDRAWVPGWFTSAAGLRKQSCRYGTLLDHVFRTYHGTGAFCALGSSGGSAELAYALTTWRAGEYLDVGVMVGGPPTSRLDLSCQRPPSAAWLGQCAAVTPANVLECAPQSCELITGFGLCTACAATPSATELREDSVLHSAAVLDYPRTRVHLVEGAADCWGTVPSAMLFYNAVQSEKVVEFVPKTNHFVAATQQGLDAMLRAVVGGAASRPGPATLAYRDWPQLGGVAQFDLHGQPGDGFAVIVGTQTALASVPPYGWVFVGNPLLQGFGAVDASGRGSFSVGVPPLTALLGLEIYHQAIIGGVLTNLVRFQLLP